MNKKKYLISGIAVGLVYQIIVILIFLVIYGYRERVMDSVPAFTFIMALVILLFYPVIWGLNTLNRLYDGRANGSKRKRASQRWSMNAGFVGIIIFSLLNMGLIVFDYLRSGLVSPLNLVGVGLCFAVLIYSCLMYEKNYIYMKPNRLRIKEMKKANVINGDRRYTFLIDEVIDADEYLGKLNGDMRVGDAVHLLDVNGEASLSKIKEIYKTDDPNENKIGIKLDDSQTKLGKYGVISSFEPCAINERMIHVENPRLVAMIKGYSEYAGDNDFTSTLVYDACHSKYIVPALVSKNEDHRGEIMDTVEDSTEIVFLSVEANELKGEIIMPIFTDWEAAENYNEVIDSESSTSLLLSFPEVIRLMRKYRYAGLALNPFGPKPFYFSEEYVNHITSLEGYKDDFVYNNEE